MEIKSRLRALLFYRVMGILFTEVLVKVMGILSILHDESCGEDRHIITVSAVCLLSIINSDVLFVYRWLEGRN